MYNSDGKGEVIALWDGLVVFGRTKDGQRILEYF
jgi:hypothetical protein